MKEHHTRFIISEAILIISLFLLGTAFFNVAHGADTKGVTEGSPVVTPAPEPSTPSIDTTVIRQTEPLAGKTAEGAPVVKPSVEVTPEGKAAAGSTDVTKTEEKLEDEMEAAPQ